MRLKTVVEHPPLGLYAYMPICRYADMPICLYAHMLLCLYAHMLAYMPICLYAYMPICTMSRTHISHIILVVVIRWHFWAAELKWHVLDSMHRPMPDLNDNG